MRPTTYKATKVSRQMRWAGTKLTRLLEKHLAPLASPRGVDLGCGMGANTVALANNGYFMTGIDSNIDSLNEALSLALEHMAEYRCKFIEEDLTGMETWRDLPFHFALALDIVEHASIPSVFMALDAVLERRGIAVVTFPPWTGPFGQHQQTLGWGLSWFPWSGLSHPLDYSAEANWCEDKSAATAAKNKVNSGAFEVWAEAYRFAILAKRRYLIRPERARFAIRIPAWFPDWMTGSMLYVVRKGNVTGT